MTGGMMFKGTPGPWFMEDGKDEGWIIAKDDALVCMMNAGLSHEEMSDNSNLIMAAPELLDALQKLIEDLEMRAKNGVVDCSHGVYCGAHAAIAKALGEQK